MIQAQTITWSNPSRCRKSKPAWPCWPDAARPRSQELETRVWGEELPDSDSLRVHIHGLRAAVDKPFDKALIQTRHGIGYRIADPDAG